VAITPLVATVAVGAPGSVAFPGTQPQQTLSAPQTLTITNTGTAPLEISSLTFAGSDPQDFLVASDGCLGQIAATASCTLRLSFAPQAQGSRQATLQIASNDPASPASVPLSGTGGPLPQGPAGANGTNGANGAQGAPGPAGEIELVKCAIVTKTVTRTIGHTHRRVRIRREKCTAKLVSGAVKFTTTGAADRASITRGRVLYATGSGVATSSGHWQLVLVDVRPLGRGRYTLTLRSSHERRNVTRRIEIMIG
jgi:hypothetical protein